MKPVKKIALIGGTGKAGKYVMNELINQGYSVRALARVPEKFTVKSPQVEIVKGNARDYTTIRTLLAGCNAIISTLGPSRREYDTCSVAVSHIIKAMQELKITRYIELAGLGIDAPTDKKGFRTTLIVKVIKWFFPAVVNDRQKAYALLTGSDIDWTIVRSPMIQLTDARRSVITSLTDSPGNKVSAADLAAFMTGQLTDERFIRSLPFIAS